MADDSWQLRRPAVDRSGHRCPAVEGYCSAPSVEAGRSISVHVSADPPSPVLLEVFRSGYEGGTGATLVSELGPFPVTPQPLPAVGQRRERHCRWPPTVELTTEPGWRSGVYLIRLTALASGADSYATFVVRNDRPADLVVQCSDFTWQAYNKWPSQWSLYDDGLKKWYVGPEVAVGFDRPYGKYCQIVDAPLSCGSGEWLLWEYPMAYWLEAEGYDVGYVSNLDLHRGTAGLGRAGAFLSVGHDEYYTGPMFDRLRAAVEAGTSIGFFGANTCSTLIELAGDDEGEAAAGGADEGGGEVGGFGVLGAGDRAPTIRRVDRFGPERPSDTALFPEMADFPGLMPSENTLIGGRTDDPATGRGDWVCTSPDHWTHRGTGMARGDRVPGLVGWEYHGDPAPIPGLEIVSQGPTHHPRGDGRYSTTVYQGPTGNTVFNAATIWWADGLSEPPGYVRPTEFTSLAGPDDRIRKITRNVIDRLIATGRRTPAEP